MKLNAALTAAVAAVLVSSIAYAQQGPTPPTLRPSQKPTVSPYTSLLGGNAPAALQYYRQVRPDMQFYDTSARVSSLSGAVQDLQREIESPLMSRAGTPLSQVTATGTGAGFMTHMRYFNVSGGAGGGRGSAMGRPAGR